MKKIKKMKDHAFGKDVYLLGVRGGEKVWLEAAKWDCAWYWGFGYIKTYKSNHYPHNAHDISSHSHWDSSIVGQQERYDFEKKAFVKGDYYHSLNDNKGFVATTLTDDESWKLADLMDTFYTLSKTAALYHQGNSHISSPAISFKNTREYNRINKVLLPALFQEVYKILAPENETPEHKD